jgi:hypothetical protein
MRSLAAVGALCLGLVAACAALEAVPVPVRGRARSGAQSDDKRCARARAQPPC